MSEKGEKMLRTKIVSTILKENLDQNVLRPFDIWHIPSIRQSLVAMYSCTCILDSNVTVCFDIVIFICLFYIS